MYTKTQKSRSIKLTFLILLGLFLGCQEDQAKTPTLAKELSPHYELIQKGQFGAARVRIRQLLDQNPDTSGALFLMGLSYQKEKQYAKAVDWFTKSTKATSAYTPAWHFLGWSHFYLGQVPQSKQAFLRFLDLEAGEPDTLFGLGLVALEEAKFRDAEMYFNSAIESAQATNEIQAKAKARLADVYVERDDWLDAERLYQMALMQNPDMYEAWYRLAQVHRRLGNIAGAIKADEQYKLARNRVRPDLQGTEFPE